MCCVVQPVAAGPVAAAVQPPLPCCRRAKATDAGAAAVQPLVPVPPLCNRSCRCRAAAVQKPPVPGG